MEADKIYTIYEIHYNFGMHDMNIEVPSYEFDRVLDHLSSEFEIHKEFSSWDSNCFSCLRCFKTEYFITDYCGNKYKVGEKFERKFKDDFEA